ncbi:MAG: iron-containing redox enzyme family protein, partial [Williamsia herbipolensis]|nr:iron-containing redox enzyme family protein [Williamsia herbipolensis]
MYLRTPTAAVSRALPAPRGCLSERLITALRDGTDVATDPTPGDDPFGDDVQLALYVAYELHYAGFTDVVGDREWDPGIIALRTALERLFLDAVRAGLDTAPTTAEVLMDELSVEPV